MRAVVARGYGGPEVLQVVDVAIPEPSVGEIRIKVQAATVNPVDVATRSGALVEAGLMAPREITGIGWDVAGEVDQLGPDVDGFTVGQKVIGLRDLLDVSLGAYADYVVLDAAAVAAAPTGLSPVEAATLPLNGLTAAQSLDLLDLSEDDTLLVTGATGAVGGFAVQLAAQQGVRVLVQGGDTDFLQSVGARWTLPRDADLAAETRRRVPGGAHAALDTSGAGIRALAAVRNRGRFVTVVGGPDPKPLRGITVHHEWIHADGNTLARLAGQKLTARVADILPLHAAAEAHTRLATGRFSGRLVLTP
ncbi:NADPH:quinone reductase-like Zn-dependent oxidoreductase [Nocardia tenerifensis]|uniref:NADPH:quinone reductase-like Zn-dependent oxidoreductase n=2 Tax=Nocardia tenerifensis TaxID=228006 RepID=A0A318KDT0_9NOCA|nr:NADPH:quinone reductase-like Zn-dependent oxidoreductase [Nocardia tenerifensis]